MNRNSVTTVHSVDATHKSFGRVASEVAKLLIGKHRVEYTPNILNMDKVVVENARLMSITGASKPTSKKYYRVSMYPGGLKETSLKTLFEKDPSQVLKKAVFNMLPKNKHRAHLVKHLTINN